MKKYLLTAIICVFTSPYLFSQIGIARQRELQRKQDSLKAIVPNLNGIAKVDALNRIVDIYQYLDDDNQMQVDSATPYAIQSTIEAKRIGYKRGLGYSYLKHAYCEYLKALIYKDKNKIPNPKQLESLDQMIKQAMQIGKELNDDIMVASSYLSFGRIEKLNGNIEGTLEYYKKAIASIEKNSSRKQNHEYEEMWFPVSENWKMNELKIGWIYIEMGFTVNEPEEIKKYLDLAIIHNEKSGSPDAVGNTYILYSRRIGIRTNSEVGLEYSKKAIEVFQQTGNKQKELVATVLTSAGHWVLGDFENGFDYSKKSVQIAEILLKENPITDLNKVDIGMAYYWMGRYYSIAGDHETGIRFMQKSLKYFSGNYGRTAMSKAVTGDMYRRLGNYDSARHYLLPFENISGPSFVKDYLSRLYITLEQYDKALPLINENIKGDIQNGNLGNVGNNYTDRANVWLGKKNYTAALADAKAGYSLINKTKRNSDLMDNLLTLSEIYYKLGNTDSAYLYLKKYIGLKDLFVNRQLIIRLNDYKKASEDERKTSQINLLNKDNQLKQQRLKQEATFKYFLIAAFIALVFAGLYVFRNLTLKRKNEKLKQEQTEKEWAFQKLESEKKQAELHHRAAELEMQALRSQMNPHFIFNCLSSINRIIMKNDSQSASDYLTRFSRLMRMVLINSQRSMITLEDELQMLRLYLDMERLRFKDSFHYSIIFTDTIDEGAVMVPPLLLQPFCENAIWHGLMQKDGEGHLQIELSMQNKTLQCVISDDGIGRQAAEKLKSKTAGNQKSMGLQITAQRLALLNRDKGMHAFYEIEDLKDEHGMATGTKVVLKISCNETVEESV